MASVIVEATAKRSAPVSRASWLRSPQRVWLRRALFQVHLWVGLALTLYAIVIGVSGSALVFREQIEHALRPNLYHLAPTTQRLSLEQSVRQIQTTRQGWKAFAIRDFDKADQATTLLMRPASGVSAANYRMVSFNPYTGEVLFDRLRYAGLLGWMANLHFYLLTGKTGLLVSGWMALGLLLLCLTGVVLWWPGVRRWASALVFHRRSSWHRLNWDLHSVVGFWSSAALIAVSVTGLYFAFPAPVSRMMVFVTGGSATEKSNVDAIDRTPPTSNAPMLTIDQAIDAARRELPSDAPAAYLQVPSKIGFPYSATGYYTGAAPYSQLVSVSLDAQTGKVLSLSDTRHQPRGQRIVQYFFAIHFGSFAGEGLGGMIVRAVWVFVGLAPLLLAVTGVLMYWNRKLRSLWRR